MKLAHYLKIMKLITCEIFIQHFLIYQHAIIFDEQKNLKLFLQLEKKIIALVKNMVPQKYPGKGYILALN